MSSKKTTIGLYSAIYLNGVKTECNQPVVDTPDLPKIPDHTSRQITEPLASHDLVMGLWRNPDWAQESGPPMGPQRL